jgi:2'-5' RNA ligase
VSADGRAPATRRLFLALWPTPQEQEALAEASAAAVAASGARRIPVANLHLTLAFLGNVAQARLAELGALLRATARDTPPPAALHFTALEYWPRPQILCAIAPAVALSHGIGELAGRLRQVASAAGFAPDLKPFRAHVSVARKVAAAPAVQAMAHVSWKCAELALVASVTGAAGSVYSVVESSTLDGAEKARK